MIIRLANPTDAPAIADIYNHYVATSHSTFELEPIDVSRMLTRIDESSPLSPRYHCRTI